MLKKLLSEFPDKFAFSVSHTTRNPRQGEVDGQDYYFVTRDEMINLIKNNEFLENAQFSGNLYGTSKRAVEIVLNSGRICTLDVDIQGVKNLKNTNLNPIYCFIKPPSLEELEKRLRARGTENEESIKKRLETARLELEVEKNNENLFDFVIVNEDIDQTYESLKKSLRTFIEF